MGNDHNEALEALLAAIDKRLETAPVVERRAEDRRAQPGEKPVDGRRADGPVSGAFAYWESKPGPKD